MLMMTVPYSFKWSEYDLKSLNALPTAEKKAYLKKEEIKSYKLLLNRVRPNLIQSNDMMSVEILILSVL